MDWTREVSMHASLDRNRWDGVAKAMLRRRRSPRHQRLRFFGLVLALVLVLMGWALESRAGDVGWATMDGDSVVPTALADLEAELGAAVHLPVEVNERVAFWMQAYLARPEGFQEILSRAGRYSAMIRGKLRDREMPEELLFLAMIESEYSTGARSPAAATGMWQFMGPTARAYGLRVDEYVDERRDPIRATDAALDYLSVLHDRYGSWYLAAAAYNAGPTRVSRVLRQHAEGRTGYEAIYWEIVDHLPRETADFVPKLLAATTLALDPGRYGLEFDPVEPYLYDIVWVPGGTRLSSVAGGLDIAEARLFLLNPHLTRGVTPPENAFGLRVPVGMSTRTVAALSSRRARSRLADD
jgi:peptidoglycan lytic transglycosylase D